MLRKHLSYSNVLATIAVVLSLGGVSYAAITLPEDSVGPRQLRPRAVTTTALGFPVGTAGVTNEHVVDLTKGPCNAPPKPGGPFARCLIPKRAGVTTPGQEITIHVRASGRLVISATVGLRNEGATTATVVLGVIVDGKLATEREVRIGGGQMVQAPAEVTIGIYTGSHTVGLSTSATYTSNGPGDVFVAPVSLNATALPPV
jgi:hypothetical protein